MSTLFDTPSKRFTKLARARLVDKGYPEYDENQPRGKDGQWGGGGGGVGSGGGSSGPAKPLSSGGAFGRAVMAAGGVAAVAAALAAAGVPGVRNIPGLSALRRKVLAVGSRPALGRARATGQYGRASLPSYGPHVRAGPQVVRDTRGTMSAAAQRRAANLSRPSFGDRLKGGLARALKPHNPRNDLPPRMGL